MMNMIIGKVAVLFIACLMVTLRFEPSPILKRPTTACDPKALLASFEFARAPGPYFFPTTRIHQDASRRPNTAARVLSANPLVIEMLDDHTRKGEETHNPQPISESFEYSPADVEGLQYQDIVSANTYFIGWEEGRGGRGFRNGIRDIKRVGRATREKYRRSGFLLYYAPIRGTPNSYLTIYRDGVVLVHDTAGYMKNRHLSQTELKKLMDEFYAEGIHRMPSDTISSVYRPGLFVAGDTYQRLDVRNPPANLQRFLSRLDSLIASYVQTATYTISYYRRLVIKDWAYEEILPLDLVVDEPGSLYQQSYQQKNFKRLSQLVPSQALVEESAENSQDLRTIYRYKGRIYEFSFSRCTNESTDTWACFRASEIPFGKFNEKTSWGYIDWPNGLHLKLRNVGKQGLEIPAMEYQRNRAFYDSLVAGVHTMYKEGDYIYQGVSVKYY